MRTLKLTSLPIFSNVILQTYSDTACKIIISVVDADGRYAVSQSNGVNSFHLGTAGQALTYLCAQPECYSCETSYGCSVNVGTAYVELKSSLNSSNTMV